MPRAIRSSVALLVLTILLAPQSVLGETSDPSPLVGELRMAQYQAEATAAGALGFYLDEANGSLVTVVPASLSTKFVTPDAISLGVDTRLEFRAVETGDIARASDFLTKLSGDPLLSDESYTFRFDARTGKVIVEGTAEPATMRTLTAEISTAISYSREDVRRLGRFNDTSPFWGGAWVDNGVKLCTTGFAVRNASGTRFLVTAGHCFALDQSVWSGTGLALGKITSRAAFPARDMELIGTKSYGASIYTGGQTGVGSIVKGAADPVTNRTIYCYSGVSTYERCDMTVTSLNASYCDSSGCTPNLARFLPCPADNGDSGAPFYLDFDLGGNPYIRGMVIARDGTGCFAHKWSTISSQFGVSIVSG